MKTYCKPLKRGASWRSQNFGDNKTKYGPHSGNDEACNIGTPVYAAGDGVIEWAGEFDESYADNLLWLLRMGGKILVLNCGDNEPSFVYAHLSKFHVKAGDRVSKGQLIADSGNSGSATTGAHLHIECIPPGYVLNSPLLGRVNPDKYLTEWPEDVKGSFMPDLNEKEQRELLDGVRTLNKVFAPIITSGGPVEFRQFVANGVRASERASENTRDIEITGGKVSLRQALADLWRKK